MLPSMLLAHFTETVKIQSISVHFIIILLFVGKQNRLTMTKWMWNLSFMSYLCEAIAITHWHCTSHVLSPSLATDFPRIIFLGKNQCINWMLIFTDKNKCSPVQNICTETKHLKRSWQQPESTFDDPFTKLNDSSWQLWKRFQLLQITLGRFSGTLTLGSLEFRTNSIFQFLPWCYATYGSHCNNISQTLYHWQIQYILG
jgi:hypothetical protein